MRGDELVRMVPWKDGKANRGHSCVKGRFAYGYATHKDRILNPMIREKITDPWREVSLGRGVRAHRQRVPPHPVPVRPRLDRRHHLVALHQRGDLSRPEADPRRLRQQQCRHLRPRLPLADRLRPRPDLRHLGRHAGFRLASSIPTSSMIIGANPTDGHPVFASRLKKRLRQGAKLIVIDPRRTEMVRSAHIEAALSSAAEARHQRRRRHRAGACHRHRRPVRRSIHPRALRLVGIRGLGGVRRRAAPQPGRGREAVRRAGRRRSAARRGSMPPAATARSITASASPSTARARPPSWPSPTSPWLTGNIGRRGRRREPAARPEQRAGRLRHGLVPARTAGLSPHLRRRGARHLREACGA